MVKTLSSKAFLSIKLKAFDLSTETVAFIINIIVLPLCIMCIACMMNSQRATYLEQTCSDPADIIMSARLCVAAIRRNT